ncbi:hypothetical protein [Spirosoma sp. KNUC1025]|nr:hypothetical protein LN737_08695 [Spirosoma sp. KNUC1025]
MDAAFVNAFARYDLPHRAEPEFDVDMALGIKQAFNIITDFYQRRESE